MSGGIHMLRIPILNYFAFGYNYDRLRFRIEGVPVTGGPNSLAAALDEFFTYLSELELRVTEGTADNLKGIRKKIKDFPSDTKTDQALAAEVRAAVNTVDATLDAELALRTAYIVTPKRFPSESLLRT